MTMKQVVTAGALVFYHQANAFLLRSAIFLPSNALTLPHQSPELPPTVFTPAISIKLSMLVDAFAFQSIGSDLFLWPLTSQVLANL